MLAILWGPAADIVEICWRCCGDIGDVVFVIRVDVSFTHTLRSVHAATYNWNSRQHHFRDNTSDMNKFAKTPSGHPAA